MLPAARSILAAEESALPGQDDRQSVWRARSALRFHSICIFLPMADVGRMDGPSIGSFGNPLTLKLRPWLKLPKLRLTQGCAGRANTRLDARWPILLGSLCAGHDTVMDEMRPPCIAEKRLWQARSRATVR
jgi:hypothetical protein